MSECILHHENVPTQLAIMRWLLTPTTQLYPPSTQSAFSPVTSTSSLTRSSDVLFLTKFEHVNSS